MSALPHVLRPAALKPAAVKSAVQLALHPTPYSIVSDHHQLLCVTLRMLHVTYTSSDHIALF